MLISIKNGKAHLIGDGFTKDGQFPFIDEFDFKNFQTKRLYTSKTPNVKEDIIDIIDANKGTVLVTQQSKNQYPNYFVRNIKNNKAEAVTQFANPLQVFLIFIKKSSNIRK